MDGANLLQVNQIGSVTESIEAVKMAKDAGWGVMTSHRYVHSTCALFVAVACIYWAVILGLGLLLYFAAVLRRCHHCARCLLPARVRRRTRLLRT